MRTVEVLCALVVASALPLVWAVLAHPISKATVYTGPITLWTGVAVALWALFSLACVSGALWIHFRHPNERRRTWWSVIAGESAFALLLGACGTTVNFGLDAAWRPSWDTPAYFLITAAALLVSIRKIQVLRSASNFRKG